MVKWLQQGSSWGCWYCQIKGKRSSGIMCWRLSTDRVFSLSQLCTQYSREFNWNQLAASKSGQSMLGCSVHRDFYEVLLVMLCSKYVFLSQQTLKTDRERERETATRNVRVVEITCAPQFIYLVTLKIAPLQGVSLLLTSACSGRRGILLPSSAGEKFVIALTSSSDEPN